MNSRIPAGAPAERKGTAPTRWIIVGGLAVGSVLGFAGNFAPDHDLRSVLFGLSAVGLILACVLLAVERTVAWDRLAAAGFLLLALGETRLVNRTDAPGGEDSFAVGVFLYVPALLLVALSAWSAVWVRIVAAVAALPFTAHALAYLGGAPVDSDGPLARAGYTLLTITIVGWILTRIRSGQPVTDAAESRAA